MEQHHLQLIEENKNMRFNMMLVKAIIIAVILACLCGFAGLVFFLSKIF